MRNAAWFFERRVPRTDSLSHNSRGQTPLMKNWLTESRFSPRCYRSFLFVPNKPEMRAGNYNYPEGCETMKKPFSSGALPID